VDEDGNAVSGGITGSASVIWGNVPTGVSTQSTAVNLLLADPASLRLFAGAATAPNALPYGDDDSFLVGAGMTALSYAQFQEVLTVAVSPSARITLNFNADPTDGTVDTQSTLVWEGFTNNRPNDRATWTLAGLHCTPPPGADAEVDTNPDDGFIDR